MRAEGGDREGLAAVLCRFWDEDEFENDASRHSFGAPFPCPACTAEAAEILASDWLRDHDAAIRAEALRPCPTCVREGGPYRCCRHCADDPDAHKNGQRDHHDLPCTLCLDRIAREVAARTPGGDR